MKKIFILFILCCPLFCFSQDIIRAEYFFDTDPGIGSGIVLNSFVPSAIADIDVDIPTQGLSNGVHILYIRTKDSSGRWSLSEGRSINIISSVTSAEYFFDTDPGIGNGSIITSSNSDSINFDAAILTSGLASGNHILYVRTKDSDGRWSMSEGRTINIIPSIVRAEYFYDTDPGVGNGISISTPTSDSINYSGAFPTSGLSAGSHVLYVRAKDYLGKWSISEGRSIIIVPAIYMAEYFYDTDPGTGNGTAVTSFTSSDTVYFFSSVTTTGLSAGDHLLYFRTRDSNGKWSLSERRTITIIPSIVSAEYFYDTDPGIGNGIAVSPFLPDDSININSQISTTGLSVGSHILFVRTKDNNGKWSLSEGRSVNIVSGIVEAEYFYDTDPGVGNAVAMSGIVNSDSINFNYLFPTNNLSEGSHDLYVRTKDSNGRWSLAEPRNIIIEKDSAILLRVFIEGYYLGDHELIAALDPSGRPTVSDQITISLMKTSAPHNSFYTQNTFLMTDGSVSIMLPTGVRGQSFYIAVQHRNSIETWSTLPVLFSGSLSYYSFTDDISKAYGNNMRDLGDGNFANWSGDISDAGTATVGIQDGVIESQDFSDLENAVLIILQGYVTEDLTGDGIVESADYSIMENNAAAVIVTMHP